MMQEHGMVFKGFGHTTRDFFVGLRDNNSKAWFEEHRDRYEAGVCEPAEAFIGELGPRLAERYPGMRWDTRRNGAGSLMRINRDIRFSPDKRPYKENLGIIFWMGNGAKAPHTDAQHAGVSRVETCFLVYTGH
jgi:uncharacterized protein (TIGR02453 family)